MQPRKNKFYRILRLQIAGFYWNVTTPTRLITSQTRNSGQGIDHIAAARNYT